MKRILFIGLLIALTSCGFKPLYQNNKADLGQVAISNDIFIDVIPDREGQILRSLLINKISRADETAKYKLKVDLSINTSDLGINIDDVATRRILWVYANFELLEGEDVIYRSKASNNVSYPVDNNEYITLKTREYEIEKSLHIIADDIKLKVASEL